MGKSSMKNDDLIREWLTKSKHDLDTASIVFDHLPGYHDMIAFHCQQSIEKSLKGYLVFLDVEFKPVHDLGYLTDLIITKDQKFEQYYVRVDEISRYAVQVRYPDSIIELSPEQIINAIEVSKEIFNLVHEKIN
jgi:HEPN domain-containing protein